MSDIPPIKTTSRPVELTPPVRPGAGVGTGRKPEDAAAPEDRVEISSVGQALSTLDQEEIRIEKVLEIREAIANGTYETEAKLDYAAERVLEVLRAES